MQSGHIVFFGTYLSASAGSLAASETIASALGEAGYPVRLVSSRSRVPARIIESLMTASRASIRVAVLDIYSSRIVRLSDGISRILAARRIPFVAVLRGGALLDRYEAIRPRLRPILEHATRLVTPSNYLRAGFGDRGFSIDHVPNPLDLRQFSFRERRIPTTPLKLLWVRAFAEVYRPEWAIETLGHLSKRGIHSTLTMIGPDRGLLDRAKAIADALNVRDRVTFQGPVPNASLATYYHSHDYFLNTTRFESFGVALAEAAATGLPVVSAAVGEVRHSWADGQNILLVPGCSSDEFAERIAAFQSAPTADESYRRISLAGREKVQEFELSRVIPQWERILRNM